MENDNLSFVPGGYDTKRRYIFDIIQEPRKRQRFVNPTEYETDENNSQTAKPPSAFSPPDEPYGGPIDNRLTVMYQGADNNIAENREQDDPNSPPRSPVESLSSLFGPEPTEISTTSVSPPDPADASFIALKMELEKRHPAPSAHHFIDALLNPPFDGYLKNGSKWFEGLFLEFRDLAKYNDTMFKDIKLLIDGVLPEGWDEVDETDAENRLVWHFRWVSEQEAAARQIISTDRAT
ncbi:hypothetical protein BJ170DRAFT_690316 [Xylariales sp. AK1849]|nr:hypothetical protein BJ170DRAFT_690316 [Xylariales sp. AK1849]